MKIGLSIKQKIFLTANLHLFFASSSQEGFDLVDDNNNYLFDRTVKKLGALADNEMFGLEPAYILGGEIKKFSLFKKLNFLMGRLSLIMNPCHGH
ncbi:MULTISPECIES: T6SS immunity protein Tdi1 domain-containing protein [Salmonella]|uniref:T6SS immunity protein Tdi1 domain-containing protein n=1 Tax=Salmonella TaxID=590 RepID=UPI001F353F6F|nr:T6SS immunity protein Tdi1 domain-containing protein [Salmonella enterica]MCZ0767878.1 DUF1851 domain-containing protein [Salmonella enterica subsp. enterica serovar Rissen]